MHRPRRRIALLVGGSVLLTLLIFMGAFNIIMQRRIAKNADTSLRNTLMSDQVTDAPTLYSPEMIAVFEDQEGAKQLYTSKELSIINWIADKENDVTERAEIDGNEYYVLSVDQTLTTGGLMQFSVVSKGDYFVYSITQYQSGREISSSINMDEIAIDDSEDLAASAAGADIALQRVVGYVDITGELEMIRQINIVFLIAALVIGVFGSTLGYIIGRKLEQNQLVQKQFFENTSHELKTPLTSIRGYAEGIEKGIITDYPRTGKTIAAQAEKMSRLVEEILCLAKLEGGALKPEYESVEISELIQDCLMPFEGTILNRGLEVELDLHPMKVSADPDKLDHAVSNLLTNALKYAQTKIRIFCGDGEIRIANDCNDLTDDTLTHLFERFYTGRDGNTGIGLSLAKELLALHGWQIRAVRTEDGICFIINARREKLRHRKAESRQQVDG